MRIKCVIAGHGLNGPDLGFVIVECTQDDYDAGAHYEVAAEWAETDLDLDIPRVVFDEHDHPQFLFEHFAWETATVIDLHGTEIEAT